MTIRQPAESRVIVTVRLWPSLSDELELELEDPWPVERALTELCDEELPRLPLEEALDRLLDVAMSEAPVSGTQASVIRPSAA